MTTTEPRLWMAVATDGEPGVGITGYGVLTDDGSDEGRLIADDLSRDDARLMAAAPALLAALTQIAADDDIAQGFGGAESHIRKLRELARAAIAKATGEAK